MENLVIKILEEHGMDSVIASSCIFVEDESAVKAMEAIKEEVSTRQLYYFYSILI